MTSIAVVDRGSLNVAWNKVPKEIAIAIHYTTMGSNTAFESKVNTLSSMNPCGVTVETVLWACMVFELKDMVDLLMKSLKIVPPRGEHTTWDDLPYDIKSRATVPRNKLYVPEKMRAWNSLPSNIRDDIFTQIIRTQSPPSSVRQTMTPLLYAYDHNKHDFFFVVI